MSVIFKEGNKRIEFSIIDYEFSMQKGMDLFDANWLTVRIDYKDDNNSAVYTDNCLLADELESMISGIADVIDGKETGIITDFMEPYLKFSLTKAEDSYAVQLRFVYDTEDWKEIYITQCMSVDELRNLKEELNVLSDEFPYREVE